MYIACERCKYNNDGECDFYEMGSGNEIDMPCYREKELIKEAADIFLQAFVGAEPKTESCEDCISRQAVLDIDFNRICLTTAKPAETIRNRINDMPSVQQKTGR